MPKHEKPFHLDMPFDEALRRYAQTEPRELQKSKEKKLKKSPRKPREKPHPDTEDRISD